MTQRTVSCWLLWFLGVACGICVSGFSAQTTQRPALVWSTAGQFTAHAPTAAEASLLCVLASGIKREWLRLLELEDEWRDPIVFVLAERAADLASAPGVWMDVARTDLHLRFTVHLRVPPPLERETVVAAVVRALCAEYGNRMRVFPRDAPVAVVEAPLWLVEGLARAIDGSDEVLLPVLQRGVRGGRPLSLRELMEMNLPAAAAERVQFRAYAWALVEGLLALPKGAEKLCQLMREPVAFGEVYRWQFADEVAAEKWWSLLLAERSAVMLPGVQSATETSRQLVEILASRLQLRLPEAVAEAPVAFSDLWRYTEKPWLGVLIRDKFTRLTVLRGVAHPLYRKAIERYLAALEALAVGGIGEFRYETRVAQRAHREADALTRQLARYLDQIEQKQVPAGSNRVSKHLKLLGAPLEAGLLRRDPISEYLDRFDRRFPLP